MRSATMLLVLFAALFQGCASIVKSEKMSVRFVGGLSNAETKLDLPDGQYKLHNGQITVLVTRSKADIPVAVTCNNETRQGIVPTKYDALAGIAGNIVFGGLIGMGIDSVSNKAYDPPATYNLSPLCAQAGKENIADKPSENRNPAGK